MAGPYMNGLKLSSCAGDNTDAFCRAAVAYLGAKPSVPIEYVGNIFTGCNKRILVPATRQGSGYRNHR